MLYHMDAEFTEPWSVSGKVAPELCQPYMAELDHVVSFHYVGEGGGAPSYSRSKMAPPGVGPLSPLPVLLTRRDTGHMRR